MNARFRIRLATVLAAAAIGIAGTACATVDHAMPSSRDMQLAQADTATTSSSSSANSATPSAAAPSSSTSTAPSATPSSSATTPSTSSSATTTAPASPASATATSPSAAATSPANDQARRIFDQLDTNHDGMLSFDEFSRATFQQK